MLACPNSSVGQLLYRQRPGLCFARIVSELDAALEAAFPAPRQLTRDYDDVALVDYDGTRITLGYSADVPGQEWAACLTIAVGSGPARVPGLVPKRQERLARMIAERINRCFPADEMHWRELDAVMTGELVDALVCSLADHDRAEDTPPQRDPFPPIDEELLGAADLRLRGVMAERGPPAEIEHITPAPEQRPRPRPVLETVWRQPGMVANDMPDVPAPDVETAAAIRAALYEGQPDEPPTQSTQLHAAAYVMNATIMVMSLPIGASVMTYSVLRGASLQSSARVMALLGTFMGVSRLMFDVPIHGLF